MLEAVPFKRNRALRCGNCSAVLTKKPDEDCRSVGAMTAPHGCETSCICTKCGEKNCCDRGMHELNNRPQWSMAAPGSDYER